MTKSEIDLHRNLKLGWIRVYGETEKRQVLIDKRNTDAYQREGYDIPGPYLGKEGENYKFVRWFTKDEN